MFISAAHKHLNQSRKRAHNMLGISSTSKVGRNLTSLRAKATWKAGGLPKGNGQRPLPSSDMTWTMVSYEYDATAHYFRSPYEVPKVVLLRNASLCKAWSYSKVQDNGIPNTIGNVLGR